MNRYAYITNELAEKTNSPLIKDCYQRCKLSVVALDNAVWYCEACEDKRLFKIVTREMEKLFPYLKWLYK